MNRGRTAAAQTARYRRPAGSPGRHTRTGWKRDVTDETQAGAGWAAVQAKAGAAAPAGDEADARAGAVTAR